MVEGVVMLDEAGGWNWRLWRWKQHWRKRAGARHYESSVNSNNNRGFSIIFASFIIFKKNMTE